MRAWYFCSFIFVSCILSAEYSLAASERIRFEDLPKLVQERNQNVKAAKISASAQKERTGFFARSFLPHLGLKAGRENAKFGSNSVVERGFWRAEARVNLYQAGQDRIEETIRETQVRSAQVRSSLEFAEELREAQKAYWKIVALSQVYNDMKEALKVTEENIRAAKRRAGAGVTTNADGVQFELESTLMNQEIKKINLEIDLLKNALAVAISHEDHKNIEVATEFPHPPDKVSEEALMAAPNLKLEILKSDETVDKLKHDQADRWWLPKIDLYSSYGVPSLAENDTRALAQENEFYAGLQISINLGQGLEGRRLSRAFGLEAEAASLRRAHTSREVTARNHDLVHDLNLLHELIHDADRDVLKAESFLKLTKSEYQRGVKNGPDLLGAFAKYYEFRTRFTELHRQYYENMADLQFQSASLVD